MPETQHAPAASPFVAEEFLRCAAQPMWAVEAGQAVPAFNRPGYVRWAAAHAPEIHQAMIHNARSKLVATYLPPARVIVDLGGAAGSLDELGYPYPFEKLIVVDLPPERRHDMYQDWGMPDRVTPNGPVFNLFTSMADLRAIPSGSVDLVWSGQSMEHITPEEGDRVCAEVLRILRPGGQFCLDTPNGRMTAIHLRRSARFIHPDHKIEYRPRQLRRKLRRAGFTIVEALGVCEMIRTGDHNAIDYRDFYASAGVNTNVEGSYIQYYRCVPARDLSRPGLALRRAVGAARRAVDRATLAFPALGRCKARVKRVFARA